MSADPALSIREATLSDLPQIQTLSHALFKDRTSVHDRFLDDTWSEDIRGKAYFKACIEKPDSVILVVEAGGMLMGYLAGEMAKHLEWRPVRRAELTNLYTKPDVRNQGLGAVLCERFIAWSKHQKAEIICVSAYAANDRGIAFYKRMGFIPYNLELEMVLEEKDEPL